MSFVDFRIVKNGKDTERIAGVMCYKTISIDSIADLLVSYPASAGYELVLDKIWDEKIEEKNNGEH